MEHTTEAAARRVPALLRAATAQSESEKTDLLHAIRILLSMDRREAEGPIQMSASDWALFTSDPCRFFVACSSVRQEILWNAIVMRRP